MRAFLLLGVVPLAFHVDYWDRLGWRDPYGQAAFSQRQRDRNRGLGWIYTPQVMLDGKDFRGWHRGLPARVSTPAEVGLTPTQATPGSFSHCTKTAVPRP